MSHPVLMFSLRREVRRSGTQGLPSPGSVPAASLRFCIVQVCACVCVRAQKLKLSASSSRAERLSLSALRPSATAACRETNRVRKKKRKKHVAIVQRCAVAPGDWHERRCRPRDGPQQRESSALPHYLLAGQEVADGAGNRLRACWPRDCRRGSTPSASWRSTWARSRRSTRSRLRSTSGYSRYEIPIQRGIEKGGQKRD